MRKALMSLIMVIILSMCFILPAFAADPIPVVNITLNMDSAIVAVGKSVVFKAAIDPKKATNKKLEWSSSDESIATVKNGTVKGIDVGTAVITVKTTDDSGAFASAIVTVVKPVKKIKVDEQKLTLAPGVAWKQSITIEPEDASIQKLTWTSSNVQVATVDDEGVITAVDVGKCNILGISSDGYKAKIQVAVTVIEHEIILESPEEIEVDFDTSNYMMGSNFRVGSYVVKDYDETLVTFRNGNICEGYDTHTLKPLKAGSDSVDIVVKHNGRRVVRKENHSVFVTQDAVANKSDYEPAPYDGKTFNLPWGASYPEILKIAKDIGLDLDFDSVRLYDKMINIDVSNPPMIGNMPVKKMKLYFSYPISEDGKFIKDEKSSFLFSIKLSGFEESERTVRKNIYKEFGITLNKYQVWYNGNLKVKLIYDNNEIEVCDKEYYDKYYDAVARN